MPASQVFNLIALVVLADIWILVFLMGRGREEGQITLLAGVALACALAGLFFGQSGWVGYGLLGAGLILALADVVTRSRNPAA